jgi:hypothetical protein
MIDKNEAMLKAIEVVTAWTDDEHNTDFVTERVVGYTAASEDEGLELTAGLVTLAGVLLQNLAKARGEGERAILRELALRVQRRIDS